MLLGGHDARVGRDLGGRGLDELVRAEHLVRGGGKSDLPAGKRHARAEQRRTRGRRARRRPVVHLPEHRLRRVDDLAGAVERAEVHRHAVHVQLRGQVQQRFQLVHLALGGVEQLRVGLAGGERGVHHAHQRHRVRGDLHERGVPGGERGRGGVLEVHGLAGHAQEVLVVVDGLTRLVHLAAIHGGKQRHAQRPRFDARDLTGEVAHDRVERAGVAGAAHVEFARELLLGRQRLHEVVHGLRRAANGGHAGSCVHSRFDASCLLMLLDELRQALPGQFHDRHGAFLVGARDHGFALAHEARACGGDKDAILSA